MDDILDISRSVGRSSQPFELANVTRDSGGIETCYNPGTIGTVVSRVTKLDLSPHSLRPPRTWRQRAPLIAYPVALFVLILAATLLLNWVYQFHRSGGVANYFKTIGFAVAVIAASGLFQALSYRENLRQRRAGNEMVLRALNEISSATVEPKVRMSDLLARLAHLFADVLQMNSCLVTLYNRRTNQLTVRYAYGEAWRSDVTRASLEETPITRRCFETGQIFILSDANAASDNYPGVFTRPGMRSFMLVPLLVDGDPVGSIQLADPNPSRVGEAEARRARVWVSQTAVMVKHRRLIRRLQKSIKVQRDLLLRTRRMYEFSEGIYQATTLAESLQKITQLGPRVLQVDHVVVVLRENPADLKVRIAATSYAEALDTVGEIYDVRGRHLEVVMEDREIVEVPDTESDASVNPYYSERFKSKSVIYAPLSASAGAPVIGALVLLRHEKGKFTRATRRLAHTFATRAAAAIENARLLEQTRLDADTKKHLLRELNHRVKNNLAGIVGLLSVQPPGVSEEVRHWIDRVVQRIVAMSRAHELLLKAGSDAPLNGLIREIVQLSITDRSRVQAELEDHVPDTCISSDKALALTMILHELCHNANVYGLLNGGILRVRTRKTDDDCLSIAVEDLPVKDPESPVEKRIEPSFPRRRSGIGLELVRALVSRELRGKFSIVSNDAGGKTATVEFPISNNVSFPAGLGYHVPAND